LDGEAHQRSRDAACCSATVITHGAGEAKDDARAVRHDEPQTLLVADGAVDGVDVLEFVSGRQLETAVSECLGCSHSGAGRGKQTLRDSCGCMAGSNA